MWLPQVENPYCKVATFALPSIPEQAASLTDDDGEGIIVVSGSTMTKAPAYSHFLLAHECCHHTLGHVKMLKKGLGQLGPQPFFYIKPALRKMELEADCCAVKLLKASHEDDSIIAGEDAMSAFGDEPTGAHYPTGSERAANIAACAGVE
ncbi:hypothetical protein [Methyloligella solikamskensis]|uniref:IrrE N-terminal-like domain-containing protein n=1 Tax=Methyloligella solikamskensis TaxID=1177756 RepID=A0ABW3J981_9HYPH